jgi:polyphosphate kinase
VVVRQGRRNKFARVKIPPLLPRFIPLAGAPAAPGLSGATFAFLEDVGPREPRASSFPGVELIGAHLFRVIRDTDMDVPDDNADDLLESVDRTSSRAPHAPPSLLQVEASMPQRVVNTLVENFEIEDDIVVRTAERLDVSDWMALHKLLYPHLKDVPFTPRTLWNVPPTRACSTTSASRTTSCIIRSTRLARSRSFSSSVPDPNVVGIKMTLYRVGANSPLIDRLIEAAGAGSRSPCW